MKKYINNSMGKISFIVVCFTLLTIFTGCGKDESLINNNTIGFWLSDEQNYNEEISNVSEIKALPSGYLQIEIKNDQTFTLYRKVHNLSDHRPSLTGKIFEPSAMGTYKGNEFKITDVNNEDNGQWLPITDERYGGKDAVYGNKDDFDKLGEAIGIEDFLSPVFTAKIANNKLVIHKIVFSKK